MTIDDLTDEEKFRLSEESQSLIWDMEQEKRNAVQRYCSRLQELYDRIISERMPDLSRWKPRGGDKHFYVSDAFDVFPEQALQVGYYSHVLAGNCFRTKEEAEYVAGKLRTALRLAQLEWTANNLDGTTDLLDIEDVDTWQLHIDHGNAAIAITPASAWTATRSTEEDWTAYHPGEAIFQTQGLAKAAAEQLIAEGLLPNYEIV